MPMTEHEADVTAALRAAREVAGAWRDTPVRARLRVIRHVRQAVADRAGEIAASLAYRRPVADTIAAEVLPLVEAARFLERNAASLLAPRRLRGGRPLWLAGVGAEIRREPIGVVLVLGPSNYPLFLPGAQILQALAAGNAVCIKPAPGCAAPLLALAGMLTAAGLPAHTFQVLPDSAAAGVAASAAGFDCIILTGSATTGRQVLASAADRLTPCIMELSGNDAVFVLPDADLGLVADCVAYGLRLNGGATCIAPRRVFVPATLAAELERLLLDRLAPLPSFPVPRHVRDRVIVLLDEAAAAGARISARPDAAGVPPIVVAGAAPMLGLLQEDVFAPVVSLVPVMDLETALALAAYCPYALGASVFGPAAEAQVLAARVNAGSVVINDLIVPTADPRLPFGGRGQSGFGVTRGAEGLLALTNVKTISRRHGRFRPHLAPARAEDEVRLASLLQGLHGTPARRMRAWLRLMRLGR